LFVAISSLKSISSSLWLRHTRTMSLALPQVGQILVTSP